MEKKKAYTEFALRMSGARLLQTVQQQQSNRLMQNPDIKHINSLDMTIQENHYICARSHCVQKDLVERPFTLQKQER